MFSCILFEVFFFVFVSVFLFFIFLQIVTVQRVQMASKTTALKLLALSNRGII